MVPALDPQMLTKKSSSSYQSSDESGVIQPLELNGFHLRLSSESFTARRMTLPNNSRLKELRREHQDWILSWREGTLYSVPRVAAPKTEVGEQTLLQSKEHLSLIASLIGVNPTLLSPGAMCVRIWTRGSDIGEGAG